MAPPSTDLLVSVSRETREKLDVYARELLRWQRIKKLVGPGTLDDLWSRHFADSLQLGELSDQQVWADLGSGAGFPGLVLAIARPGAFIHLLESDGRKCAFLRHVARLTAAPVRIWEGRIEALAGELEPKPRVVTARALAPLTRLLGLAEPLLAGGATGLFPKGQDYRRELTEAAESWRFGAEVIPSRVDANGRILKVRDFLGPKPRPPSISG